MNIDHTHDQQLTSWVESDNESSSDFPIQNLPYCSFSTSTRDRRVGVGIGDQILDLRAVVESGCLSQLQHSTDDEVLVALGAENLNAIMALSVAQRRAARHAISELLSESCSRLRDNTKLRDQTLLPQSEAAFHVPAHIRDYSDFYASVFHATNVGSMFRPDNPLLPNYKWIPIGYHGRASSIVISGTSIHRPVGQLSPEGDDPPAVKPCNMLDYELEVGIWVAQGNQLGQPVPIQAAEDHLFGLSLVNDWSARDVQKWEYQPLGPFLAKSFATTVSPWVVTTEALAPFRAPAFERESGDPQPLAYLQSSQNQRQGGFDIFLDVKMASAEMRQSQLTAHPMSHGTFRDLYWTPSQMITHHTMNGCNLAPGDLLASGTVSGRERSSRGCLLELTWDGELGHPVPGSQRTPIQLPDGSQRKFLMDGDEVIMSGYCERKGFRRIGFGECRGIILPAVAQA